MRTGRSFRVVLNRKRWDVDAFETLDDIEQACLMIAASIYQGRKRDPNLNSESLGGYSYSLRAPGQATEEARTMLEGYKAIR